MQAWGIIRRCTAALAEGHFLPYTRTNQFNGVSQWQVRNCEN
jgi:hypothetical protein